MPQAVATALQIISFLAANKDTLKALVTDIQTLIPDAPGDAKAAQVKAWIGSALNVGSQLEAAWPLVKPLFDTFVAIVKTAKPAQ